MNNTKIVVLTFCLFVGTANAVPIITNGSLSGDIDNGGVPLGWDVISPSPDTIDENSNVGFLGNNTFQATPSASADGGTWVGMASLLVSLGQIADIAIKRYFWCGMLI
jgi:hypothetical protein